MRLLRHAALALVFLATPADAGPLGWEPRLGPPLILRLDGVIATDRDEARRIGFTAVGFGVLGGEPGTRIWLAVEDARTIGGDHALLGKDVLDALAGYRPTLFLAGAKTLVARVTALAPGTPVRLDGLVDRGARTFLLRDVAADPPR